MCLGRPAYYLINVTFSLLSLSLESGSFEQTASQAALDMTADDSEGLKRRKETKKWSVLDK